MDGLQCRGVSFSGFECSMELKTDMLKERSSSNFTDKNAIAALQMYVFTFTFVKTPPPWYIWQNFLKAFETALWYPEEIANALWNLHSKVAEKYYGRPITCVPRGLRGGNNLKKFFVRIWNMLNIFVNLGKPLRPHQQSLCQACSDGICRIGKGSQSVAAWKSCQRPQ